MLTRAPHTGTLPARLVYAATVLGILATGILGQVPTGEAEQPVLPASVGLPAVQRDFDEIHAGRSLRVLMTNSSSSYYVLRGEEFGFEYELARQVASELDLHLKVVLPDADLTPMEMLQLGAVDIIAMPLLPEEQRTEAVALTVPYNSVQQRLVVHSDEPLQIQHLKDLDGLQIAARRFSSGARELARLRGLGINLSAVLHAPDAPQEEILDLVADGTYKAAIALDVEVESAQRFRKELRQSVALGPRKDVRWAVRSNSPQLLAALDEVLSRHVHRNHDGRLIRSEFYNVIHARYFEDSPQRERHESDPFLLARTGRISPYDDLFRRAGREQDLDWRLLAALAFQESRFDPAAVSWAGACGLMQLRPRTAGVDAAVLADPRSNVNLGAAHLRMLYDLYDEVQGPDRLRFALAAYNCGQGHLSDARELSKLLGHDPDVWEGSVRESLLLLRQPTYHRMVRYGYVRGNETVAYVREIEQRFELLQRMVPKSRTTYFAARSGAATVLPGASPIFAGAPSLD